jgi:hypothetical protein
MGIIIARWENSEDNGIYWTRDDQTLEGDTLFEVMERYLTGGETMEILSYAPRNEDARVELMANERIAHRT